MFAVVWCPETIFFGAPEARLELRTLEVKADVEMNENGSGDSVVEARTCCETRGALTRLKTGAYYSVPGAPPTLMRRALTSFTITRALSFMYFGLRDDYSLAVRPKPASHHLDVYWR